MLDEVAYRVDKLRPGDALVAHILLPHFPYVLDKNCNLKEVKEWTYPRRHNTDVPPQIIIEGFWDQSICTHSRIKNILDSVADRDDIVVIVHGDHGARIDHQTDEENDVDTHGTFLAIKAPGLKVDRISKEVQLQSTFIESFQTFVAR